jgi:hypothetical protein
LFVSLARQRRLVGVNQPMFAVATTVATLSVVDENMPDPRADRRRSAIESWRADRCRADLCARQRRLIR